MISGLLAVLAGVGCASATTARSTEDAAGAVLGRTVQCNPDCSLVSYGLAGAQIVAGGQTWVTDDEGRVRGVPAGAVRVAAPGFDALQVEWRPGGKVILDDAEALALQGRWAEELGRDREAVRHYERALALQPGHAAATAGLVRVPVYLAARRDPAKAWPQLSVAVGQPDPPARLLWAAASSAAAASAWDEATKLAGRCAAVSGCPGDAGRLSWQVRAGRCRQERKPACGADVVAAIRAWADRRVALGAEDVTALSDRLANLPDASAEARWLTDLLYARGLVNPRAPGRAAARLQTLVTASATPDQRAEARAWLGEVQALQGDLRAATRTWASALDDEAPGSGWAAMARVGMAEAAARLDTPQEAKSYLDDADRAIAKILGRSDLLLRLAALHAGLGTDAGDRRATALRKVVADGAEGPWRWTAQYLLTPAARPRGLSTGGTGCPRVDGLTPEDERRERRLERGLSRLDGLEAEVMLQPVDLVNAFATRGGCIVVTRGLVDALTDDDQLAAVLAHELGHLRLRHVAFRDAEGQLAATLLPPGSADPDPVEALALLQSHRAHETEADAEMTVSLLRADIDPIAGISMLRHLEASGASSQGWSHPSTDQRVRHLSAQIREIGAAWGAYRAALAQVSSWTGAGPIDQSAARTVLQALQRIKELRPAAGAPWYNLALTRLMLATRTSEAKRYRLPVLAVDGSEVITKLTRPRDRGLRGMLRTARLEAERALLLRPDHAPTRLLLGAVLAALGEPAAARRAVQSLAPDARLAELQSYLHGSEQDPAGVLKVTDRMTTPVAIWNRAVALTELGRSRDAASAWDDYLRAPESDALAQLARGARARVLAP